MRLRLSRPWAALPVGSHLLRRLSSFLTCSIGLLEGLHPLLMTVRGGERTPAVAPLRSAPLVAIFNSCDKLIEEVRSALDAAGFAVATARLAEIQSGILDLVAFIEVHDPDVIVYDLPRPYENHWNFLKLLKETNSLRDRQWILTTTDKRALDAAVGASGVVEIIVGQPYGADDVVEAVRLALETRAPVKSRG